MRHPFQIPQIPKTNIERDEKLSHDTLKRISWGTVAFLPAWVCPIPAAHVQHHFRLMGQSWSRTISLLVSSVRVIPPITAHFHNTLDHFASILWPHKSRTFQRKTALHTSVQHNTQSNQHLRKHSERQTSDTNTFKFVNRMKLCMSVYLMIHWDKGNATQNLLASTISPNCTAPR